MAFNIMDMIASLTGGADPNQAVLNANGAIPPGGGSPQAAAQPSPTAQLPPIPTTPQGAKTPFTNPMPPQSSPSILQSPGDLTNMYMKLMTDNRNAQQLDSGLSLIAAGLTPNLSTRQALIQGATGAGAGKGITSADIINLQKQEQATRDLLTRQAMLGGLMKQYKMSPEQIKYLEASGKLDEVIKHYSTEDLGITENAETGQKTFFEKRTGKQVGTLGGEKPEETMEVTDPNTGIKYLANKHTGEKIKDLVGATKQPEPNTGSTGIRYPGLDTGFDYKRDAKGLVDDSSGRPVVYAMPGTKAEKEQIDEQQKKVEQRMQSAATSASVTSAAKAIETALDEASFPGAVGLGSKLYMNTVGQLGGMAGNVIRDNLDTIKANASFEKLAQMRQASPTGGALGNISDFENRLLSSATATLSPNLKADKLLENVQRVQATMELIANKSYKDEATFKADLEKRIGELQAARTKEKTGITVKRREQPQ